MSRRMPRSLGVSPPRDAPNESSPAQAAPAAQERGKNCLRARGQATGWVLEGFPRTTSGGDPPGEIWPPKGGWWARENPEELPPRTSRRSSLPRKPGECPRGLLEELPARTCRGAPSRRIPGRPAGGTPEGALWGAPGGAACRGTPRGVPAGDAPKGAVPRTRRGAVRGRAKGPCEDGRKRLSRTPKGVPPEAPRRAVPGHPGGVPPEDPPEERLPKNPEGSRGHPGSYRGVEGGWGSDGDQVRRRRTVTPGGAGDGREGPGPTSQGKNRQGPQCSGGPVLFAGANSRPWSYFGDFSSLEGIGRIPQGPGGVAKNPLFCENHMSATRDIREF
ncbi:proline-rich proteoglycan 2-like [Penaeus monodon]|uniref:proline-rich proteoglycan 2-like n=1 Tax=Penaeus monodon TaxID=6687 RepID=UPI0018A70510|nr:proline-rich proteoglycan 2-like [Penaeus monodon]